MKLSAEEEPILSCVEYEPQSQVTSEFWIHNCEFEISFDLSKLDNGTRGHRRQDRHDRNDRHTRQTLPLQTSTMQINDLPNEMLSTIFSYCHVTDLLTMQAVCQRWSGIITTDKGIWNHILFDADDFDFKTTINLLGQMPMLRSINLCFVRGPEELKSLIQVLCDSCWDIRRIKFPESSDIHPTPYQLYTLNHNFPKLATLQICTKQKLTAEELIEIGEVLKECHCLKKLCLIGFYWNFQNDVVASVINRLEFITCLELPSLPGLRCDQLNKLIEHHPLMERLKINITALSGRALNSFSRFKNLTHLKIIDESVTNDKLNNLKHLGSLVEINLNLDNTVPSEILAVLKDNSMGAVSAVELVNCGYLDTLLPVLTQSCARIQSLRVHNTKSTITDMSNIGLQVIMNNLKFINFLDIKSRSLTKAYYSKLKDIGSLKWVRINGMKVNGCV